MSDGLALGYAAAERAAKAAGGAWQEAAYAAFCRHAAEHATFTTEDVRFANESLPPPPDARAWGAVSRAASRAGVVTFDGYSRSKSPKVHGMKVTRWRSLVRD